jgi:ATP-dependent RNA helicase DeaD
MDLPRSSFAVIFSKKEEKFKKRLEKIVAAQDLSAQRELIGRICQHLSLDVLDCAAALVLLSQANLAPEPELPVADNVAAARVPLPKAKMVCYRLEVGAKHNVTVDEIKQVFVTEAGVDIKMIGEVTIHFYYSLIELPEGMPTDIYQLLTTVSLQQQKLNIKRLKTRERLRSVPHHLRRKKSKLD